MTPVRDPGPPTHRELLIGAAEELARAELALAEARAKARDAENRFDAGAGDLATLDKARGEATLRLGDVRHWKALIERYEALVHQRPDLADASIRVGRLVEREPGADDDRCGP